MEHLANIIWEYSPEFHREPFPNIPEIYHGNVSRISHEHIFSRNHSADFDYKDFMKIYEKMYQ